jgi:hypothetical protein
VPASTDVTSVESTTASVVDSVTVVRSVTVDVSVVVVRSVTTDDVVVVTASVRDVWTRSEPTATTTASTMDWASATMVS